jgi:4-amino-4-deoxy-L-arabinose transferase-like glycosyltransferase
MPSAARPGRLHLAALAAIVLLGLGLRIDYAVDSDQTQLPDSLGYAQIAENLYRDGDFDQHGSLTAGRDQQSSNYAPGLPLFVGGLYKLTGGVHLELARILLALIGSVAIVLTYLIGVRLGGPTAGLLAALAIAVYPAFLEYHGMLMTEPLAATLLAATLLAAFWASDRGGALAWGLPGLLLGLMAMVRPEYLLFGALLPLLALFRAHRGASWRPGIAAATVALAAFALPILPWTIRNAIVLDRLVPISTGSGKVLFVGTSLSANGDGARLQQLLLERHPELRRELASQPHSPAESISFEAVLAAVAAQHYPGLPTDEALGRMGRDNLRRDISDHTWEFAGMLVDKTYDAWRVGPREIMEKPPWSIVHKVTIVLGLIGLALLAWRRRWEAVPFAALVLAVSALSALLIASPRRVIVILPVLAALAGMTIVWLAERLRGLRATG